MAANNKEKICFLKCIYKNKEYAYVGLGISYGNGKTPESFTYLLVPWKERFDYYEKAKKLKENKSFTKKLETIKVTEKIDCILKCIYKGKEYANIKFEDKIEKEKTGDYLPTWYFKYYLVPWENRFNYKEKNIAPIEVNYKDIEKIYLN